MTAMLLSFCNQSISPFSSAFLRLPSGCQWLDMSALSEHVRGSFSGVCGLCALDEGGLLVTQGEFAVVAHFKNVDGQLKVAAWRSLDLCKDPHSIVFHDGYAYIVSTGANAVVRLPFDGDVFGAEEEYWTWSGVESNRDAVHLNGLALDGKRLIASCFGARSESGKWTGNGQVFYLDTGEIVCCGLLQPHTPLVVGDELYFAESGRGLLHSYRRSCGGWSEQWISEVGGYPRGVARAGGRLFVGVSESRKYSRSTKTPLAEGSKSSAYVLSLSLEGTDPQLLQDLNGVGREVYDILPIMGDFNSAPLSAAVIARAKEAESSFDRSWADLGWLWMLKADYEMQEMESGLVSIILPTYNRGHLIRASVLSVLAQTYENFELIIVDDGSTDDTPNVISAITDPRVRYVQQPNRGRSHARNHGISLARGRYLAFLDSDDLYVEDKLERQVKYLREHPETGMVYTSAYCIDGDGTLLEHRYLAEKSGFIYQDIAFFTPVTITLPTVMTYRSILQRLGGFDEGMYRFEDTDMWRRMAKTCRIDAMPEFTCLLRTHDDNHLINQCADAIESAIDYYAGKIMGEDTEVDLAIRKSGLAGLYGYYAHALMTVPQFFKVGQRLLGKQIAYLNSEVSTVEAVRGESEKVYRSLPFFIKRVLNRVIYRLNRLW